MDSSTTSSGNNENHFVSNNSSTGLSAKKRKLSIGEISSTNIETKLLQSAILEWKQYAQKLESEKLQHINECNGEKILELEDTVKQLQAMNAELHANNEQHQSEIQSIINENTTKINTLENEKQEFESKIKELADEIATIKTIKSEIKDSVENERETFQTEITKLKDENQVLETKSQKTESILLNKNKEIKKKYDETTVVNQTLEKKCKTLEATISKNKKEYESTMDELKSENQELKNRIQVLENNEREEVVTLDEAFNGSKLNLSLFSCKTNIIMNVSKIDGSSPEGWKLYSTLNESENPRLLTEKDMMDTCFKMNITDQFIVSGSGPYFRDIMRKINTFELTKLELISLQINFLDYLKLVSSKTIQICTLNGCTVLKEQNNNKKCEMDELLMHLPNIIEFKYHSYQLKENFRTIAKNFGKLYKFRNLQKFEISQFYYSLDIEDMDCFIKKNNKDVSYVFKFPLVYKKSLQSKIKRSEKQLLKALPIPYNIRVELQH